MGSKSHHFLFCSHAKIHHSQITISSIRPSTSTHSLSQCFFSLASLKLFKHSFQSLSFFTIPHHLLSSMAMATPMLLPFLLSLVSLCIINANGVCSLEDKKMFNVQMFRKKQQHGNQGCLLPESSEFSGNEKFVGFVFLSFLSCFTLDLIIIIILNENY